MAIVTVIIETSDGRRRAKQQVTVPDDLLTVGGDARQDTALANVGRAFTSVYCEVLSPTLADVKSEE